MSAKNRKESSTTEGKSEGEIYAERLKQQANRHRWFYNSPLVEAVAGSSELMSDEAYEGTTDILIDHDPIAIPIRLGAIGILGLGALAIEKLKERRKKKRKG